MNTKISNSFTSEPCCQLVSATLAAMFLLVSRAPLQAFEGRICTTINRGGETTPLAFTVGTNSVRIEVTLTNRPFPVDILDRQSGWLTLIFPHNRSFVRLEPALKNPSASAFGFPATPAMPSGIGPQAKSAPGNGAPIGPTNLPGVPPLAPAPTPLAAIASPMPSIPPMPLPTVLQQLELKPTAGETNLLGLACRKFEITQRGQTMEIWATGDLLPFQPYQPGQPHRFGPQMLEEQWGRLLAEKKLFPLLAVLKLQNGTERYRFEVTSITPTQIEDISGTQFQPPRGYREVKPLPF